VLKVIVKIPLPQGEFAPMEIVGTPEECAKFLRLWLTSFRESKGD